MAPSLLAIRQGRTEGTSEPLAGLVISVVLSMLSISVLSAFTTQRFLAVKTWKQLPCVQWLVFAIYADSFLFVLATGILQLGFGVSYSGAVCDAAILLCLVCYVTTKVSLLIYMFLVEKAYIIRSSNKKPRLKSKLYIFNSFGMIGAYCVVVVPNFVLRFARVENGECIIGMQRPAMIPLIVFDLLVNVYLTIIFLRPVSGLYSYKHFKRTPGSQRLRTMAMRTFIGCICTLISSIVNLSVLVGLNGEPGWVCLMCCNSDILFSAVVIFWVTSRDSTTTTDDTMPSTGPHSEQPQHNNNANAGDELSAIPHRANRQHHHRHRLPNNNNPNNPDPNNATKPNNNNPNNTSTETMVNDAAKMACTTDRVDADSDGSSPTSPSFTFRDCPPPPTPTSSSSKNPFRIRSIMTASDEQQQGQGQQRATTQRKEEDEKDEKEEDEDEDEEVLSLPPSSRGGGGGGSHHHGRNRAASEVRVDVDYGATSTSIVREGEEGGGGGGGGGGGVGSRYVYYFGARGREEERYG
ncbi:hypothetical protein C8A00DRAFT_12430 [Chaetomidium leptoderma]|uniref:Uncharacterized protein n=1 Tax=Chaetomidium leptoderma TaxID=669021 RepID=A0AAN6VS73_9PEZI|nr:hypothetical protein C8A00DRAFT_12430 [Chaetomidium leptoderma]